MLNQGAILQGGANLLRLVGGNAGYSAYSPDGLAWSAGATLCGGARVHDFAYGAGRLVAVGEGATVSYSRDGGKTWTDVVTGLTVTRFWAVEFLNGLFLAVGDTGLGAGNTAGLWSSPDGVSWTFRSLTGAAAAVGIGYIGGLYSVVLNQSNSGAGTICRTSPDLVTWTNRNTPIDAVASKAPQGLESGNGVLLAYGGQGMVMTTPDGFTWTLQASAALGITLYGAVWDGAGAKWRIAGSNDRVGKSTDNINWTYDNPVTAQLHNADIARRGDLYLMLTNAASRVYSSPDGTTWTNRTLPGTPTFTNGFCAVF